MNATDGQTDGHRTTANAARDMYMGLAARGQNGIRRAWTTN